MNKKMYCYDCDEFVSAVVSTEKNKYTIHGKEFYVLEQIYSCPNCKSELNGEKLDDSLKNIYESYLNTYGLNQEDFKKIRLGINLSQELFSKALGWNKRSVIRYENGDSLPQKQCLCVYQKLKSNKNEFIKILNDNESLSFDEYSNIYQKINPDYDLKTINIMLYLLNENELYQTQIMKYLFAIDFLAKKELDYPLTCLKYANAQFGPIINDRKNLFDFLVFQNYLNIKIEDNDKVMFSSKKKYIDELFTSEEKSLIDKILTKFKGKTSTELSLWSHEFEGWKKTKPGEFIDYKYAKYFNL